MLELEEIGKFC